MSAGADRVVVSHDVDGWRWSYKSNGRTIAVSPDAYTERAACLHGLFLATGLRLDFPKGWRGTQEQGWIAVQPRRVLREQTRAWRGLTAEVHDFPGVRVVRHIARTVGRAAEMGHAFDRGGWHPGPWWACSCGAVGDGAGSVQKYRWVGFTLHARQVVEGR
jgi:hypothetical protein